MRILICDDQPSIRQVLRTLLEGHGHAVAEAGTLLEATMLLDSRLFQVAIIDGQFPMDPSSSVLGTYGPLLCRQARAVGARALLLSGNDDLVAAAEEAGFPAMRKPFSPAAILEAVRTPLAVRREAP